MTPLLTVGPRFDQAQSILLLKLISLYLVFEPFSNVSRFSRWINALDYLRHWRNRLSTCNEKY